MEKWKRGEESWRNRSIMPPHLNTQSVLSKCSKKNSFQSCSKLEKGAGALPNFYRLCSTSILTTSGLRKLINLEFWLSSRKYFLFLTKTHAQKILQLQDKDWDYQIWKDECLSYSWETSAFQNFCFRDWEHGTTHNVLSSHAWRHWEFTGQSDSLNWRTPDSVRSDTKGRWAAHLSPRETKGCCWTGTVFFTPGLS